MSNEPTDRAEAIYAALEDPDVMATEAKSLDGKARIVAAFERALLAGGFTIYPAFGEIDALYWRLYTICAARGSVSSEELERVFAQASDEETP